ncbi:MAG: HNH endonuclease [Robiginitomaculum sp.]
MAKLVFIHNENSKYDDQPERHYHFPKQYLNRAKPCVGDWVLYYESGKNKGKKSFKAVAEVKSITDDLKDIGGHYYANIVEGSYLPFEKFVPFRMDGIVANSYLADENGKVNGGRAISAVQPISDVDFWKILDEAFPEEAVDLQRTDEPEFAESQTVFTFEEPRQRVEIKLSKWVRKRSFRVNILDAYDRRCAFTGLRFINGGGRAEVEAAHIQPVAQGGSDSINNGLALSGTIHWMFDRGLLSLSDKSEILVSRHINNIDEIDRLLVPDRMALLPKSAAQRPHAKYLEWHRENCFKV